MIGKCNSQRRISMTAKKVTQTTKKAENVKINAPAKTVETAKAETAVKAETEVKEAPKAETVKAEPAKAEAPKAEAKKAPAKKAAPKKVAPKKPEAKAETKVDFFIEFGGVQVSVDEVIKNVKLTLGKDAKEISVYLKPEESKAYFVADGEEKDMDVFFC